MKVLVTSLGYRRKGWKEEHISPEPKDEYLAELFILLTKQYLSHSSSGASEKILQSSFNAAFI